MVDRGPNEPTGYARSKKGSKQQEGPPIFGRGAGRWSINSDVRVYWWAEPDEVKENLCDRDREERSGEGKVVGLHKPKGEGWIVIIDFGPVWSLIHPKEFRPAQVEAL